MNLFSNLNADLFVYIFQYISIDIYENFQVFFNQSYPQTIKILLASRKLYPSTRKGSCVGFPITSPSGQPGENGKQR